MNSIDRLNALTGTEGDKQRHGLYRGHLVELIARDPRWQTLGKHIRENTAPLRSMPPSNEIGEYFYTIVWNEVRNFTREELKLPWLFMVADLFEIACQCLRNGEWHYKSGLAGPIGPQSKRHQNANGDSAKLHAEWFYRVKIKSPPATLRSIAQETSAEPGASKRDLDTKKIRDAVENVFRCLNDIPRENLKA